MIRQLGEWQGRTGTSATYPMGLCAERARQVEVDLPALRAFGQAIYANTEAYLATMTPEEWARSLDLTEVGMGHLTIGTLLTMVLLDGAVHCGEISAVMGSQGYPF